MGEGQRRSPGREELKLKASHSAHSCRRAELGVAGDEIFSWKTLGSLGPFLAGSGKHTRPDFLPHDTSLGEGEPAKAKMSKLERRGWEPRLGSIPYPQCPQRGVPKTRKGPEAEGKTSTICQYPRAGWPRLSKAGMTIVAWMGLSHLSLLLA